jgi:ribosomal protein S12 methylthiotransferase accessory factor
MSMIISFPGGVAVDARYQGFTIRTDQPPENGGAGNAFSPFDLFIASLGTCAGFFALRFCQQRQLSTTGLELSVEIDRNPESKRLDRIGITLRLPEDFPEKYRAAIVRAADQCAVKQALLDPPEIVVTTSQGAA